MDVLLRRVLHGEADERKPAQFKIAFIGAGIHAQRAADRAGNAAQELETGQRMIAGRQRDVEIERARTGQGAEMWTGYSRSLLIDSEMLEANRENNTLQWAKNIGNRPFMVVVAQYDELINNTTAGKAAIDMATGPKEYIVVPDITHFEMYSGKPFEISSEAAAR